MNRAHTRGASSTTMRRSDARWRGCCAARGMRSKPIATAEDFLKKLGDRGLDCALVDVRMPGETGLALAKFLRISGIPMPVILMTGDADVTLAAKAARYGACALLAKPLTDAVLVEAIEVAVVGQPSVVAKPADS